MFDVYHFDARKAHELGLLSWECRPANWLEHRDLFTLVAKVECDNLDDVYRLTNSIDRPWSANPEVELMALGPQRSSSVGDVFVNPETGVALMVANAGFEELPNE